MEKRKIGVIVGSLREGSFNKSIAKKLASQLPENYEAEFLEIGQLPFYNEDLDAGTDVPKEWEDFRVKVKAMDAYLFVTPEYNRSMPAVLKNALDVASRPYGENVWSGKTAAVISASPGATGGFGANHHLRQSLVFLNVITMQQPEAYLGNVTSFINEDGSITSERTVPFLQSIIDGFVALTEQFYK
ncbi:NAD(P)H-dependent oxidoreductase [Vagococcus coleopterorum]|uniref:NAD(P)H-dependent oxidoreductase n=1 Tax=Vagococcus coleopterorum TaxID=2714946 RepID=A0A6G8ANZ3_9ENTE|nr:NAD(P)H-dependent oxidoreductase [Vagococcus coleopterorum]QIL46798.1 NAD(P)H-dependent oxidoreductase [Vagococcus coleopterorum]